MSHDKIDINLEPLLQSQIRYCKSDHDYNIHIITILLTKPTLNVCFVDSEGQSFSHHALSTGKCDKSMTIDQFVNLRDNSGETTYIKVCRCNIKKLNVFKLLIEECKVDITMNTIDGIHGSELIRNNGLLKQRLEKLELRKTSSFFKQHIHFTVQNILFPHTWQRKLNGKINWSRDGIYYRVKILKAVVKFVLNTKRFRMTMVFNCVCQILFLKV